MVREREMEIEIERERPGGRVRRLPYWRLRLVLASSALVFLACSCTLSVGINLLRPMLGRGQRIGEAANPGPRTRIRFKTPSELAAMKHGVGTVSTAVPSGDTLLDAASTDIDSDHQHPTQLDTVCDIPSPRSGVVTPPLPADPEAVPTVTEADRHAMPAARVESADVDDAFLDSLLLIRIVRPNAKEVPAKCNFIPSKRAWRWQCRSKPALITVERKSPASSLLGFLQKNRDHIAPDCILELESHASTLQQHEAALGSRQQHHVTAEREMPSSSSFAETEHVVNQVSPQALPSTEDMLAVIRLRLGTERYIPLACQSLLVRVVKMVLHPRILRCNMLCCFILPKLLWPRAIRANGHARGHMRQKEIARRATMALDGQWQVLIDLTLQRSPTPAYVVPKVEAGVQAGQVLRKAALTGNPSKAWRQLRSFGIAPPTLANWETTKQKLDPSLHETALQPPSMFEAPAVALSTLHHSVCRLRQGKAMDAGGWAHESMQLLWQSQGIREDILRFLSFAYGQVHDPSDMTGLLASRVVMLCKDARGSIRPILLQMNWLKAWHSAWPFHEQRCWHHAWHPPCGNGRGEHSFTLEVGCG